LIKYARASFLLWGYDGVTKNRNNSSFFILHASNVYTVFDEPSNTYVYMCSTLNQHNPVTGHPADSIG
jgi:hypothetical protein